MGALKLIWSFRGAQARFKTKAQVRAAGGKEEVVARANALMEELLTESVASFDLAALELGEEAKHGTNACWCTTNVVSRERSRCSASTCITLNLLDTKTLAKPAASQVHTPHTPTVGTSAFLPLRPGGMPLRPCSGRPAGWRQPQPEPEGKAGRRSDGRPGISPGDRPLP